MTKIFHPLLALIASATDRELAKYVQFLKEENKIVETRRFLFGLSITVSLVFAALGL